MKRIVTEYHDSDIMYQYHIATGKTLTQSEAEAILDELDDDIVDAMFEAAKQVVADYIANQEDDA